MARLIAAPGCVGASSGMDQVRTHVHTLTSYATSCAARIMATPLSHLEGCLCRRRLIPLLPRPHRCLSDLLLPQSQRWIYRVQRLELCFCGQRVRGPPQSMSNLMQSSAHDYSSHSPIPTKRQSLECQVEQASWAVSGCRHPGPADTTVSVRFSAVGVW